MSKKIFSSKIIKEIKICAFLKRRKRFFAKIKKNVKQSANIMSLKLKSN
jgi:hypothetical protein